MSAPATETLSSQERQALTARVHQLPPDAGGHAGDLALGEHVRLPLDHQRELALEDEVDLFLVLVAFCFFEFGFYILVALLAKPLLGALAWWSVAIGNAIAAFGMGYYLWREHPKIGEELKKHPLGETQEGE